MKIDGYDVTGLKHLRQDEFFFTADIPPQQLEQSMPGTGAYFQIKELTINGGRRNAVIGDWTFLGKLTRLRATVGQPFIVSNYGRTQEHNSMIGGHPTSAHMVARGIDIKAPNDAFTWQVVRQAPSHGFKGIGVRSHGGSRYIHLDDVERSGEIPGRLWTYP